MTERAHHQGLGGLQHCIQECLSCHTICLATVSYCLQKGGEHAAVQHIRLLLDCSDICQTSASFMLRGSEMHKGTCAVCAEVCERCADDCERLGDDAAMHNCAAACRRCAESCRWMATSAA